MKKKIIGIFDLFAHDLKNSIMVVNANVEILRMKVNSGDKKELELYLEKIERRMEKVNTDLAELNEKIRKIIP